jgi:pimeloyl-ACP methyl ester carboxylesterase
MASSTSPNAPWKGKVPFEDTALAVTDTGGDGVPVVYLNGQFTTQLHWKKVIAALGTADWRHITFDERARGKSDRSADYSFEAAVRDVDAVLAGRGIDGAARVLVVGWSYGAFVAAHWAARNPRRCRGAVFVDGAYPYDWLDEAMEARIRALFRRLAWAWPLLRPAGLAPRMSAAQQAESNIEIGAVSAEAALGPVLDAITVPARYIVAAGSTAMGRGREQREAEAELRRSADAVAARNAHVRVAARVDSSHSAVLRKDSAAVVAAMREIVVLDAEGG